MTNPPFRSPYIPNTASDQTSMLGAVGIDDVEQLFSDIPSDYRNPDLSLPNPLSEMELRQEMERLANKNFHPGDHPSFLGAGAYRHFTPAVVPALVSRGEFLTSYTPYQPEVSQGTLQATYEFQTLTCQLLGMEVANAGMYDIATSLAEAALMSCRLTKRYKIAVVETVNPNYQGVVRTYATPQEIDIYSVPSDTNELQPDTACLLVQSPNFYGYIENIERLAALAHANGALLCVGSDPIALAMFKSPGSLGADIAVAEGQALGVPPSFGGPYVGMFACRQQFVRQMPGRIVGKTTDTEDRTGYVLTLQPREQHIRRERATSNICTSTALVGLWATIYAACLGKNGLRHIAELCYQKSHYAASKIAAITGYSVPSIPNVTGTGTFFQEFVITCPRPAAQVIKILEDNGIVGGLDIGGQVPNGMLVCVTEINTRNEIDQLVSVLEGIS